MSSALPIFIRKHYDKLKGSKIREENADIVRKLFENTLEFLGKLCILEYAQLAWVDEALNYKLFSLALPAQPQQWFEIICSVVNGLWQHNIQPVLPLFWLKKYPSLQAVKHEDSITQLLEFCQKIRAGCYIPPADLQEYQDKVIQFVDDLDFLNKVQYKTEDDKTTIKYQDESLPLYPFFKVVANEQMEVFLDIEQDGRRAFENCFMAWYAQSYQKFQIEKSGSLDFTILLKKHRESYVIVPWLEVALEETFSEVFSWISGIDFKNVILVEGYPNSGKTALAANISPLLKEKFADQVICYFISPNHITQEFETFENWCNKKLQTLLPLQQGQSLYDHLRHTTSKIIIGLDGLQHFSKQDYQKLQSFIQRPPWNKVLFIFFKRLNTWPRVDAAQKIVLKCEDNIDFFNSFTKEYIESLSKQYVTCCSFGLEILKLFAEVPHKYMSAAEIAQRLGVFTPKILKQLMHMKPLLSVVEQKYRLFHPTIGKQMSAHALIVQSFCYPSTHFRS